MFRCFKIQRPLKQPTAPKWNLLLVFNALTRPPFKPHEGLERGDIKFSHGRPGSCPHDLRRRGHVYHLDASQISFTMNNSEVSTTVPPEFVSKRLTETNTPIDHQVTFLALTITSDKADQSFCPVRALRIYLEVTKKYKESHKRLFLPLTQGKHDFRADVLNLWIHHLIIHAHQTCPKEQTQLHHGFHETRGIDTS